MQWKKYTIESVDETLGVLRTTRQGLTAAEAKRRLLEYGKNTVPTTEHLIWRVLKRRFTTYLSWVFVIAAAITFFFGNVLEAICILIFLLLNASLEIYQEFHSAKAARTLQRFLIPKARVVREGRLEEIASSALVPGDIVELRSGETLPADVRFLEIENLVINETLLHRNRGQVQKSAESVTPTPLTPSGATNIGFAGTMMVKGRATAVVIATGIHTALGDIAHEEALSEQETPFEKNIRNFSHFLIKLLLFGLVGVFGLYYLVHGEQVAMNEMLIFTLALAIAVIPEAFPALTALALARGSVRLAKQNVIVKRLSAIEDLGSVEVLCLDKTGILTENTLTVTHVYGDEPHELLRFALLASHSDPKSLENLTDTFDMALWQKAGEKVTSKVVATKRLRSADFDPNTRLRAVLVEENRERHQQTLIVRGAPEEVLRRAEHMESFTRKVLQDWIQEAGARGERVLAVATKEMNDSSLGLQLEGGLMFQGLISFLDPIKPGLKKTVALAERLGVEIKIFSGDSKETVGAVGYAAGLTNDASKVITGTEFEVLSLPEQIHALENYSLFARFSPGQKAAAVQLLEKSHTVGAVGSSFTDIAMLQAAHVAIVAEGAGGITREAGDILLLERELAVVVTGIHESRRIFANILKYLKITLAANFGNFYSIALAAIFLPFLPLLPLQILLLNFLSDIPMLAIATDRVDQEKLERPKDHSIHAIIVTATLFGALSSFFDLTFLKMFSSYSAETVRTAWFLFSVFTQGLLLYSLRSRRWFFKAERSSGWLILLSLLAFVLAMTIPYTLVGGFFGFEKLALHFWVLIITFTAGYFVVTEILKRWYYLHREVFTSK